MSQFRGVQKAYRRDESWTVQLGIAHEPLLAKAQKPRETEDLLSDWPLFPLCQMVGPPRKTPKRGKLQKQRPVLVPFFKQGAQNIWCGKMKDPPPVLLEGESQNYGLFSTQKPSSRHPWICMGTTGRPVLVPVERQTQQK